MEVPGRTGVHPSAGTSGFDPKPRAEAERLREALLVRRPCGRRHLGERTRVVHANHRLVIHAVSEADSRTEAAEPRIRELPAALTAFARTRVDQRSGRSAGARIWVVGEKSLQRSSSSTGGSVVSQRRPRLTVSFGLTFQSSWKYPAKYGHC